MATAEPSAAEVGLFVIEDMPIVLEGIVRWLDSQPRMRVCGAAEDFERARPLIARAQPALLVMDLFLRREDGLGFIEEMNATHPGMQILVLSQYDERIYAPRAIRAGAAGYVMKQHTTLALLVAIQAVLRGEVWVSREVADRAFLATLLDDNDLPGDDVRTSRLSNAELRVFRLLGEGRTLPEISTELRLPVPEVESLRSQAMATLGIRSPSAFTRRAIRWVHRPGT